MKPLPILAMVAAALLAAALLAPAILAAPPQSQSRRLWDVQLLEQAKQDQRAVQESQKQSPKTGADQPSQTTAPARPAYLPEQPQTRPIHRQDALVGITIWRLRPAAPDDSTVLTEADAGSRWTPIRVRPGDPLSSGDRVRIAIEAPSKGYLYVIDREMYTDGSESAPFLIFPTRRVRFGDNHVEPGRLIEIPDQGDTPPYFRLQPRDAKYRGEQLTVIVAPAPLPGIALGRGSVELPAEQVQQWEASWGGPVEQFELRAPPGAVWTPAEQMAGIGSRLLVQEEPMPQTIYRVTTAPDAPLLVELPLKVKDAATAP
jgi:hypothetical protein